MTEPTILLVEDNEDDVALTLRAFQKNRIANDLVVVRDGVEAWDYFLGAGNHAGRIPAEPPALVLLDLKLPRLDGRALLRRMREDERTRLIPVVVLTSSREESDVEACYRLGANSFIRKPVEFEQFVNVVGQLGRYWLQLNERPPQIMPSRA